MQILILEKNMKYGIKSLSNKHLFLFTKEKTLYYGFKGANILKFKLITNSLLDVKIKDIDKNIEISNIWRYRSALISVLKDILTL